MLPIAGAKEIKYYRNKLEFTFSNKRYLTSEEIKTLPGPLAPSKSPPLASGETSDSANPKDFNNQEQLSPAITNEITNSQVPKASSTGGDLEGALGYHVPRIFDKIIDIHECYLMDAVNNQIRNNIRDFAGKITMPFTILNSTPAGSAISLSDTPAQAN